MQDFRSLSNNPYPHSRIQTSEVSKTSEVFELPVSTGPNLRYNRCKGGCAFGNHRKAALHIYYNGESAVWIRAIQRLRKSWRLPKSGFGCMDTGYSKTSEVFHKASKSCRFLKDFRSLDPAVWIRVVQRLRKPFIRLQNPVDS